MGSLTAGDRLGRYRLARLLGAGGMGEVWEAVLEGPAGFRKPVALKVLRSGVEQEGVDGDALLHEARLGARLQHPNVVSVHMVEESDRGWLVAMELVRGANLAALARPGPLSGAAALDAGIQACRGLAHIHDLVLDGAPAGLVHRDVKPSNLLVDRTGLVKVLDLGIAGVVGGGGVAGTPGYAPPEQWAGEAVPASDLFALAVTLIQVLTGRRMFPRSRSAMRRLREPPSAAELADVDARVPGLGEVLRACLHPDPAQRPAHARALGRRLGRLRGAAVEGPGLAHVLSRVRPELAAATPDDAPTRTRHGGHLPPRVDRFVGRESELRALVAEVEGGPGLVTLVGQGGMGKTRLAVEAAACLTPRIRGGVLFFDLTEARSADDIVGVVARGLGVRLDEHGHAGVARALAERSHTVVVLDNLEQCVVHLPDTLGRWMDEAREVTFLCTSRVVLGLQQERPVSVGPLELEAAITLFRRRSPVRIPREHGAYVRAVVDAVDRLPLAIELAAAQTRTLGMPELRAALDLRRLGGGGEDRPERHRSMEASLRWSWDLLGPAARRVLAQLSVCEGGFALEAVEGFVDAGPGAVVFDALQELLDASLIRIAPDTGRGSLLSVVHAFASDRLDERGDASEVERRHGEWLAQLRIRSSPDDLDNLIVATRRAAARDDRPVAAACALGAWELLYHTGPFPLAVRLLQDAAACTGDGQGGALACALLEAHCESGRPDLGERVATRALERLDAGEIDVDVEPRLKGQLAMQVLVRGSTDRALRLCEEALAAARRLGSLRERAVMRGYLGIVHRHRGSLPLAIHHCEAAVELHEARGDHRLLAVVRGNLGLLCLDVGQLERAEGVLRASMVGHEAAGNHRSRAIVRGNLGRLHHLAGRSDRARATLDRALEEHREVGNRSFQGITLGLLAQHHLDLGELQAAERAATRAVRLHRETRQRTLEVVSRIVLATVQACAGSLDEALELARGLVGGSACVERAEDRAVVHALLGALHEARGEAAEAAAAFEEVERLLPDIAWPEQQVELQVALADHLLRSKGTERARAYVDAAAAVLDGRSLPWSTANLRISQALLARARGDTPRADALRAEAEADAEALGVGAASRLARRLRSADGSWLG